MSDAFTDTDAPTLAADGLDAGFDAQATRPNAGASMIGREIIGQYVVRDKLGEGGMGEVYLAEQPGIGRQVAIKVVHPHLRGLDDQLERFRNEAKAAASLASPHIVEIFNWGELDDGTSFMAMEYLHGQTLGEFLREKGSLEPELCVSLATQICLALGEAHAAGIVHRDLKPSNVMLLERGDDDGQPYFVKVLDFGVAKLEGSDITRSGAMFGTPQYMSPEQLRAGAIDGRSDLYSLGVMLYEMLSGALPFVSPTAVGYITAHLHDEPPALPKTVPSAVAELVLLLLAKTPAGRPADAAATASELHAALSGGSPAARRRVRRRLLRTGVAVSLISALIVGLGLTAWQLWQWRSETQTELELERERTLALERQVLEQAQVVAEAREHVRRSAEKQLETTTKVREQRREMQGQDRRQPRVRKLDAQMQAMLTRTRPQLEADLDEVLAKRRIPPSEVAEMRRAHASRVARLEAGQLDDDALREELVSMIVLYRKSFDRKRAGDELPLARLEQRFLAMRTASPLGADDRRAMLDAIYEAYEGRELSDADRSYYKQLEVAKLVREHQSEALDPSEAALPTPELEPHPGDEGKAEGGEPGEAGLPSLDGL